jgi:hypothetical protein
MEKQERIWFIFSRSSRNNASRFSGSDGDRNWLYNRGFQRSKPFGKIVARLGACLRISFGAREYFFKDFDARGNDIDLPAWATDVDQMVVATSVSKKLVGASISPTSS